VTTEILIKEISTTVMIVAFVALVVFIIVKRSKPEDVLKLKILISFGQVIQSFATTYNIQWPDNLHAFFEVFNVFNLDLFSLESVQCMQLMWRPGFYTRFWATVSLPILLSLAMLVCCRSQRAKALACLPRKAPLLITKTVDIEVTGQWASRFFFLLIFTYIQVSGTVLEVFKCRTFEPAVESALPRHLLESDYSVDCDSSSYYAMKIFAVVALFLFPVGVPAFFIMLMWRERRSIHDFASQKKYGLLFADYASTYFLWEVYDLGRKLLLSGALIFFHRGSVAQLLVAMMIAFVALQLQLRVMPYKSFVANVLQVLAFNAILLNLVGAMLLKVELPDMETGLGESFADGFLLLVNVTVPMLVILLLALSFGRDVYQLSVGRMVKSGLRGRSRHALIMAIANRKASIDGHGLELPTVSPTRRGAGDDCYSDLLLHDELVTVQQQRDSHKKAATSLAEAEATLAEKREFYRFLKSQSQDEKEFRELLADEAGSFAAYMSFKGIADASVDASSTTAVPNPLSDDTKLEEK
jgi:hypothetical protein